MADLLKLAIVAGCFYAVSKNRDLVDMLGDPEEAEKRRLAEEKRLEEEKNIQVVHIHHHY